MSDVAELPSGIDMEIESLRLDFHVYANLAERRGSPWKSSLRDSVSNWGFSKLTSSSLYSLTLIHTHTHTLSLSHKPERSHSLTLTLTFSFPTLTKLSHFLSISHMASHIHTRSHTHRTPPALTSRAQPSPATRPTRLSLAIGSSPPWSLSPSLGDPFSFSPSLSLPPPYPFRFCLVSYLFDFLFWLLWNFGFGFGYLTFRLFI